jgi:hypothetical protein
MPYSSGQLRHPSSESASPSEKIISGLINAKGSSSSVSITIICLRIPTEEQQDLLPYP